MATSESHFWPVTDNSSFNTRILFVTAYNSRELQEVYFYCFIFLMLTALSRRVDYLLRLLLESGVCK